MSAEHLSSGARASAPTAQVINLGDLHADASHRHAHPPVIEDTNPLHAVRTQLKVCVGQVEVTVGELLAAREQQVLVLDRTLEQPVDLMLEGKVVARGQLVAVDGKFAIRISELPVALKA
jgi:flagellar motor switch protein FliN/FliY